MASRPLPPRTAAVLIKNLVYVSISKTDLALGRCGLRSLPAPRTSLPVDWTSFQHVYEDFYEHFENRICWNRPELPIALVDAADAADVRWANRGEH